MRITIRLFLLLSTLSVWAEDAQKTLYDNDLGGDLWGLRPVLNENGIDFHTGFIGESWTNIKGGIETGTKLIGVGYFNSRLDLETIADLKGSFIEAGGFVYQGAQPTETMIGADPASNISTWESGSNFWRFHQLFYGQKFFDDSLTLHIGQLAADEQFMISDYSGLFLNAQFGTLPNIADNINMPVYPLAAPGVYGNWQQFENPWFARAGLYTADAGQDISSNIGFDWELGGGVGAGVMVEAGREYELYGRRGKATLGALLANSEITDYATGQTKRGFYSLYLMVDQVLSQDSDGNAKWGGFFRFNYNPQSARSQQQYYLDTGVNLFEPIPGRVDDTAGIAIGYQRYYGHYHAFTMASGQPITRGQAVIEVTYEAMITKWLIFQPDFQVILDPAYSGSNAYVLGLTASVNF